ncbi:MAG: hypothetical protein AAFU49_22665 [Pseudomonadota bacterium]
MQIEIKRVGLVSAGGVGALIAAIGVLVAGIIYLVSVGLSGEMALLETQFAPDTDLGEDLDSGEAATLLGVAAMVQLSLAGMGAMAGGFVVGMFSAAFYNVVAGVTGGLVVEMEPLPER